MGGYLGTFHFKASICWRNTPNMLKAEEMEKKAYGVFAYFSFQNQYSRRQIPPKKVKAEEMGKKAYGVFA